MIIRHTHEDIAYTVLSALESMKQTGDKMLEFEKGRYNFYPDYAAERVSCILNHDNDGYKKIGIPIIDFDGITIEGNGAELIFHGVMVPIEITNSRDVTVKNLSVDYPVAQYAHATVLESGEKLLKIKIWDNSPFKVVNHSLKFTMPGAKDAEAEFFLDIDSETDFITEGTSRTLIKDMDAFADENNTSVVTLSGKRLDCVPKPGNTLCIHFGERYACGVFMDYSKNVTLENVTLHHALGMGVLCQKSENITLEALKITPSDGRYVSSYADATHFVNCRGNITLNNCFFEKHFDDCLNCHGIYMQIDKFIDKRTVLARFVHHQQLGVDIFEAGESVEFINHNTLMDVQKNIVKSVKQISRSLCVIEFENETDKNINLKDCIESLDAAPNLTVTNCTMQKAFPRGLLITTRGKVRVENNRFNTFGSCIHISGDTNHWFESGCVRDVTIRNNIFDRCGIIGKRSVNHNVINIFPQIPCPNEKDGYYHKNIIVTNNTFITAHPHVLKAVSTENLVFKDNEFDIADTVYMLDVVKGDVE
ncbi:MAG: hypothetical protein E7588_00565 [Ruminococcaceae bacterium]|nr:hypothetical protein [Oscillospiraceae bacterium]